MIRSRVNLHVHDLIFHFKVPDVLLISIFMTSIQLIRLQVQTLIIWPPKKAIRDNIPACFKKHYPKVWCIIDCSEIVIETLSNMSM